MARDRLVEGRPEAAVAAQFENMHIGILPANGLHRAVR